jgi:hypothetical protein
MKLSRFWRRSSSPRPDYVEDASALFERFATRHGLYYEALDAPVEIMWVFPIQEKLSWPLTLGLQNNDELNFGVPGFWSYFFPFPKVAKDFESYLDLWVTGQARIVRHPGWFRITSVSSLEILTAGQWNNVYGGAGDDWPHAALMIQNRMPAT